MKTVDGWFVSNDCFFFFSIQKKVNVCLFIFNILISVIVLLILIFNFFLKVLFVE